MDTIVFSHEYFMREALKLAQIAFAEGEIPVGAVIVANNVMISKAYNQTELLNDVTAHAEMLAYTAASNYLGSKYLLDCTLYTTLEPCVMCAAAGNRTQISRIVFGAYDNKKGFSTVDSNIFNSKTEIIGGILHDECKSLLDEFFKSKR